MVGLHRTIIYFPSKRAINKYITNKKKCLLFWRIRKSLFICCGFKIYACFHTMRFTREITISIKYWHNEHRSNSFVRLAFVIFFCFLPSLVGLCVNFGNTINKWSSKLFTSFYTVNYAAFVTRLGVNPFFFSLNGFQISGPLRATTSNIKVERKSCRIWRWKRNTIFFCF